MKLNWVLIGGIVVVLVIAAAIVPMWWLTAGIGISGFGVAMIVAMIVGCFAVGGGLMFLIFYSARSGHDDSVHQGIGWHDHGDWPKS